MIFRLAPPQSYGWSVYADCLASHGFQHVVALQEDNPYWNSGARVIEARLDNLGVRFTRLPLIGGSTACIRQVQGMRSEHPAPDILLMLVAYPEPFVSLAREASEHGLVPPACFLGDPAGRVACQDQWGVVGTGAMSVPFLSYLQSEHSTAEGQRISKEFKGRFGREPTFVAYEGYDSVLVFARACADAGSVAPGAVCDSLRKISVLGTRGIIRFSTEPDGVVHQQWKWPPVCVVAYARPQQTLAEADLLWDAEHGHSGRARLRHAAELKR
jgi:ABC-type branched-subunit amino acid transport system substrate-binding protein